MFSHTFVVLQILIILFFRRRRVYFVVVYTMKKFFVCRLIHFVTIFSSLIFFFIIYHHHIYFPFPLVGFSLKVARRLVEPLLPLSGAGSFRPFFISAKVGDMLTYYEYFLPSSRFYFFFKFLSFCDLFFLPPRPRCCCSAALQLCLSSYFLFLSSVFRT